MCIVEVWEAIDGEWRARLVDPITGPDWWIMTARSRGSVIAEVRCRLPRTHLEFQDRFRPVDG